MVAGRLVTNQIEDAIRKCKSAAVLLGKHGLGDWQNLELDAILSICFKRNIPVIPVLLPSLADEIDNTIPLFLQGFHWVKLKGFDDVLSFKDFVVGVRGHRD
jgi:hypothetical protein